MLLVSFVGILLVLAQDFGVRCVGHGWNTALGVGIDLDKLARYATGSQFG